MQLSDKVTWTFLSLAALCVITTIVVPIVTRSIDNAWYGLEALLFIVGIYNVSLGTKKLRIARRNEQRLLWYQESTIDLGIASMLLALLALFVYGIADNLSASIGLDIIYGINGLLGVALLVFGFLSIKYTSRKPSTSQTSR